MNVQWNTWSKPRETVTVVWDGATYGLSLERKWWEIRDGVPYRRVHGEMGHILNAA